MLLCSGRKIFLLTVISVLVLSFSKAQHWLYDDSSAQDEMAETETDQSIHDHVHNIAAGIVIQPIPTPAYPSTQPDEIIVPGLGVVHGKTAYKHIKGRPIDSFLGLKYGVVSPGLGRFQRALAYEHYSNEPIDATQVAPNCPQFPDMMQIIAAEARHEDVDNCLSLNIHVPSTFVHRTQHQTQSVPVMVFIHGEMLFDGSAEEAQPDYLLEHDVVLVSVNYRLAPFGFLTTLSNEMPGNVALADIHLALEWIQKHIRAFGGDPLQVTLVGQAGGATLVHALSLSDKALGLFHKLILQSGTALNPFFLEENALATAHSLASLAHCPRSSPNDVQSLNRCFERLSTTELLQAMKRHYEENEPRGLNFMGGFKLTVGDKLGYLPVHPAALLANRTIPMILGVTKDAGAFILTRFYDELTRLRAQNISDYINVVLRHTVQPRHYLIWKNLALREIFNEEDARNPTLPTLIQGLLELTNLILHRGPILDTIRTTFSKAPTYLYCFDYRGEYHRFGHLKNPLPFEIDATLSDDNIYLFPYPEEVSNLNPKDRTLSRALVTMWVNFASYDIPNLNKSIWPNPTNEVGPFLRIINSDDAVLEVDQHFGDGITVPNLYPEYFNTTTTTANHFTTTTTTTTTETPFPAYSNYPTYNSNYRPNYFYRPRTSVFNGSVSA